MRRCLHCNKTIEAHELTDAVRYGGFPVSHGHCYRLNGIKKKLDAWEGKLTEVSDEVNGINLKYAVRKLINRANH